MLGSVSVANRRLVAMYFSNSDMGLNSYCKAKACTSLTLTVKK